VNKSIKFGLKEKRNYFFTFIYFYKTKHILHIKFILHGKKSQIKYSVKKQHKKVCGTHK